MAGSSRRPGHPTPNRVIQKSSLDLAHPASGFIPPDPRDNQDPRKNLGPSLFFAVAKAVWAARHADRNPTHEADARILGPQRAVARDVRWLESTLDEF